MTWRHLWRKRIFTFLNIFGLAVGIASCWMIFKICSHEFSYEKNIPGVERTYRVITQMVRNDRMAYNGGVAAPLYQGIREELTGWEYVVPVFEQWVNIVHVNRTDTESYSEDEPGNIIRVDASYFEMLPYKWILGSPESSFNEINQVVLTKSRAQAYFPDTKLEDILNKQIIYEYFDTTYVQVSGIVEDLIGPTEFVAKEFIFLPNQVYENYEWTNTNGSDKLYIKLYAQTESVDFLNQIEVLDIFHL